MVERGLLREDFGVGRAIISARGCLPGQSDLSYDKGCYYPTPLSRVQTKSHVAL